MLLHVCTNKCLYIVCFNGKMGLLVEKPRQSVFQGKFDCGQVGQALLFSFEDYRLNRGLTLHSKDAQNKRLLDVFGGLI